jgi:hypothetical protein
VDLDLDLDLNEGMCANIFGVVGVVDMVALRDEMRCDEMR